MSRYICGGAGSDVDRVVHVEHAPVPSRDVLALPAPAAACCRPASTMRSAAMLPKAPELVKAAIRLPRMRGISVSIFGREWSSLIDLSLMMPACRQALSKTASLFAMPAVWDRAAAVPSAVLPDLNTRIGLRVLLRDVHELFAVRDVFQVHGDHLGVVMAEIFDQVRLVHVGLVADAHHLVETLHVVHERFEDQDADAAALYDIGHAARLLEDIDDFLVGAVKTAEVRMVVKHAQAIGPEQADAVPERNSSISRWRPFPSSPCSEKPALSMMILRIPFSPHSLTNCGTTAAGVMMTARSTFSGRSLRR